MRAVYQSPARSAPRTASYVPNMQSPNTTSTTQAFTNARDNRNDYKNNNNTTTQSQQNRSGPQVYNWNNKNNYQNNNPKNNQTAPKQEVSPRNQPPPKRDNQAAPKHDNQANQANKSAGEAEKPITSRLGPREERVENENKNNNQKGGQRGGKNRGNENDNRGKGRQQNETRIDNRRDGGRPRGPYNQRGIWERLYEIQGEQYDLEPLDTSEKKFNAQARLFAGSLGRDMKTEDLEEMFKKFGEVGQIYHNKEGAFAFINLDYRSNAEKAVRELNGSTVNGRHILIRFAAITTGVKVKNLSNVVTNELLHKAFSIFGDIEVCRITVDDRGKPTGEGTIIFAEKRAAVVCYKKCNEESFFLTSQLRPVIVDPYDTRDDEDGYPEANVIKNEAYRNERRVGPRFAEAHSFESDYGKRWKQLFDIYKEKKTALENDLKAEMEALEVKMALVIHQQETDKLRRELATREQEAFELQRGLGNYENSMRQTQLGINEAMEQSLGTTGVKRSHDYYEGGNQLIERHEFSSRSNTKSANYDDYYRNNATSTDAQFNSSGQRSYAGVVSGVSGASYDGQDNRSEAKPTASTATGYDQTAQSYSHMYDGAKKDTQYDYESASKRARY